MIKDIHARGPVNKTASVVVFAKGVEFNPKKIITTADSEFPLPTKPVGKECVADLTGMVQGRFVVIGLSKTNNQRWVVRCSCGTYTLRTAKSLKNEKNNKDCCEHCRHLEFLKRSEYFRITGKDKP